MAGVDVVIVNYNAGAYLARALAALQAQTMHDFRIIIVDNGSQDGSLDALPARFPSTSCNQAGTWALLLRTILPFPRG